MASEDEELTNKIDTRPHICLMLFGRHFKALLDTGSTASYIRADVAQWVQENGVRKIENMKKIKLADGSIKETMESVDLVVTLHTKSISHRFSVMPELNTEILIGDELLKRFGIRLTSEQGKRIGVMENELNTLRSNNEDEKGPINPEVRPPNIQDLDLVANNEKLEGLTLASERYLV